MTETDGEVTAVVYPVPATSHGGRGLADDEAFMNSHPEVVCEFLVAVERAGGAVDDQFREAVILSDGVQAMDGPEAAGLIAMTSMRWLRH